MSHMQSIRGFFSVVVLALIFAFGVGFSSTAFAAPQIVVEGANVDPSTLKPYFSGTDPASVQRGVDDLKATGAN